MKILKKNTISELWTYYILTPPYSITIQKKIDKKIIHQYKNNPKKNQIWLHINESYYTLYKNKYTNIHTIGENMHKRIKNYIHQYTHIANTFTIIHKSSKQ
uniref:hypothetical protein n=1 Tax=Phyllorhiza punctata TaxID=493932 RepID=UPI002A813F9B|nr:hypothetical protein UYJ97_mgp02 [Phyllorhiza punctata]WOE91016.1 hypothetical protein [Phyllorhiza punctata]